MSDVVDAAVEGPERRVSAASGIDGSVKFVIEDEGAVLIDEAGARAGRRRGRLHADRQRRDLPRCSTATSTRPRAFMSGRLAVEGDMGLAMRLGSLLGMTEAAPFHADVADAPEGARAFWLTAADGVRLRAVVWAGGARGTAVIFPGRTEFAEKYGRVAGRAGRRAASSVAVIDWRGQGLSRPAPGNADARPRRGLPRLPARRRGAARPRRRARRCRGRATCSPIRWAAASASGRCSSGADFAARGLLGADVAAADEGGDARADRADDPARRPAGLGARLTPGARAAADRAGGRLRGQRADLRPGGLRLVPRRRSPRIPSWRSAGRACSGPGGAARRWRGSTSRRCRSCRCWCCSAATRRWCRASVIRRAGRARWPRGELVEFAGRAARDLHGDGRRSVGEVWERIDALVAARLDSGSRAARTAVRAGQPASGTRGEQLPAPPRGPAASPAASTRPPRCAGPPRQSVTMPPAASITACGPWMS